jgi:hypothetical protein
MSSGLFQVHRKGQMPTLVVFRSKFESSDVR